MFVFGMVRKLFFILILLAFAPALIAQLPKARNYYTGGYFPIKAGLSILEQPFMGGFNRTQFQNFDLNNDGILDLVCFDRCDNKILPFLRIKNDNFHYAPQYETYFPEGETYYKMADLNADGKADIFTLDESSNLIIFLNITKATDSFPKFKNLGPMIYRNQYAPPFPILYNALSLSKADLPEISDVDGDGDIDIVTYDQSNKTYSMYSDVRADFGWSKDTFEFQNMDICFGYFSDSANAFLLGFCPYKLKLKPRHTAGASLLMFDNDEDGDKEMVLSNIGQKTMTLLKNGKKDFSRRYDTMLSWDSIFPRNTTRACNYNFPAGFLADIDGDKVLDLITSPNGDINDPLNIREVHQLWYYKNFGKNNKPDFRFQKDNLLQEKTLDLGGKTAPALADYDADGDLDLFVANDGNWEKTHGRQDRIAVFKNVGKKDSASYELVSDDYLSISNRGLGDLIIRFGDVDGDGDIDMLAGERSGEVSFYKNTAGKGNPFNLVLADSQLITKPAGFGITNAAPTVYNYDHDSLPDLLVGYYYGGVKLFKNIGTKAKPKYTLSPGNAWGIRANEWYFNDPNWVMLSYGNSVPVVADIDKDGYDDILLGGANGKIRAFHPAGRSVFDSLTADTSWLWQKSLTDSMPPDFGAFAVPEAMDLDGDSVPEIIVGNLRGGLNIATSKNSKIYKDDITSLEMPQFILFPNPGSSNLTIKRTAARNVWEITIFNFMGQQICSNRMAKSETEIVLNPGKIADGVYFVEVKSGIKKEVKKWIVINNN
jgi:hypothetical protein